MKTHRETGDRGCRAVILNHFALPLAFASWRLSSPFYQETCLREACAVRRYF